MKAKRFISIFCFMLCMILFVSCGSPKQPTIDFIILLNGFESNYIGEELPARDFMIKVVYSDGFDKTVTIDNVIITNYEKNILGNQTLTYSFTFEDKNYSLKKEIKVIKKEQSAPELSAKNVLSSSIEMTPILNTQYSIDDGLNWQDEALFNNLAPNHNYIIKARYKETPELNLGKEASIHVKTLFGNEIIEDNLICVCSGKETTKSLKEINENGNLDNWRTIILMSNENIITNKLSIEFEFPEAVSETKLFLQVDYSYFDKNTGRFIYEFDYATEVSLINNQVSINLDNIEILKYDKTKYASIALSFYDNIDLAQNFLDDNGEPNNKRYGNHNPNVNFRIIKLQLN